MRYTKEFKLEYIQKYINGKYIDDPGGCTHNTFHSKVLHWYHIYEKLGETGLDHNKPTLSFEDKLEICHRVENGESFTSIAISYGRQAYFISNIYKKYLSEGLNGLQSSKKGRPPKMKKIKTMENAELDSLSLEEQNKILRKQLEEAKLENEFLKKLDALVQKRMAQQRKK